MTRTTKAASSDSRSTETHVQNIDLVSSHNDDQAKTVTLHAPLHALITGDNQKLPNSVKTSDNRSASINLPSPNFLQLKSGVEQAWLVGSQVIGFDKTVNAQRRNATIKSSLLAQLAAQKKYPNPITATAAQAWQSEYLDILTKLGWTIESGKTVKNISGEFNVSIDKMLLKILETLLPGGSAITLAEKVVNALTSYRKNEPLITIFEERTVEQDLVDFSMSLASSTDRGFLVYVIEYALDVRTKDEQVLFFKWDSGNAIFNGRRFDITLSDDLYKSVSHIVESKLESFMTSYVANIEI